MWKKLLSGLIFGTGFGIATVCVWVVAVLFVLPSFLENRLGTNEISLSENTIGKVPPIVNKERFLGYPASYLSDFERTNGVLASGPGRISGTAMVNGEPVEGLKLQLALNGSVMSQWVSTDVRGRYEISVPYGEYVIQGFQLDQKTADKVLANRINHPQTSVSSQVFEVSESDTGRGPKFRFVDPVVKSISKNKYSLSEEIVLEWQPYPEAEQYSVQIIEKPDPYAWSNKTLFPWSEKPTLSDTAINVNKYDIDLKPGHFYILEVSAEDAQGNPLSETAGRHTGYDFEVVE